MFFVVLGIMFLFFILGVAALVDGEWPELGVVAIGIAILFGSFAGRLVTRDNWRDTVITKGYAHWALNSSTGETTFKWNDKKQD